MPPPNPPVSVATGSIGPLPAVGNIKLLVLAPESFISALQPLISHKNSTGIPAMSASVESLVAYYPGTDSPEKIKQAICDAHRTLGTQYIMLVGDAANFPVRFWFCHHGPTFTYPDGTTLVPCSPSGCFIQSDLYYANLYRHTGAYPDLVADVFDNWDANGNGLYNEAWMYNPPYGPVDSEVPAGTPYPAWNPDKVDGYPDIAVGRLPASNVADVQNYVQKVIAYETRVLGGDASTPTFTFVADQLYGSLDQSTRFANTLADKRTNLSYLIIENGANPAPTPFQNATPQQVATQAGISTWVSYLGHGGPTAWGKYSVFQGDDVALTKNATGWPVVFASGCGTALFMPNTPWNGYSGLVTSIDTNGARRGPFDVNPASVPGEPGVVVTDRATNETWGVNTPGSNPLPVATPSPNPLNISIPCCGNLWLLDNCPGGSIIYIGDHCVSNDGFPADVQANLLTAYAGASQGGGILGDFYLTAQRQYWKEHSTDATTPNSPDYHGIPRLYLGWMVYFGDPSLRLPQLITFVEPHIPLPTGASDSTLK